jgi:hypothetical protein
MQQWCSTTARLDGVKVVCAGGNRAAPQQGLMGRGLCVHAATAQHHSKGLMGWNLCVQAVTALKKLNVPYLVSLPLVFQTTEEWLDSELGVHPVQVALQVCDHSPACILCLEDTWHVINLIPR